MLANWITLSRFPLLLISALILYRGSPLVQVVGAALLFLGLMLDTVDGIVARRMGQTSLFGSVLDIAADRMYELVLWVCFADLGMVPMTIPFIIVARTTLTDALRSVGVAGGTAPLDQQTSALGRFLVASSWMRTGYAASKIITFCGLALARAWSGLAGANVQAEGPVIDSLRLMAWVTAVLCVARGLPAISGSLLQHFRTQPDPV
ncbi:MAG TPA: CDP-alcohol phosphatidyltransferase family protein [Gemmatimonadales bacterium]